MLIGVVGTGKVARDCHLPFLKTQQDVELAYFDRVRESAEACVAAHGGKICDSIESLMAAEPDVLCVLTNETSRGDVLTELLAFQPKRIFCEKPLVARNGQDSVTEEDFSTARDLLAQHHAQGCETAMNFNYRFFDQVMAARRIVAERNFGEPLNVVAAVNYACWSHAIDLMHYFVGPTATISAQEGNRTHKCDRFEAKDILGSIVFANGATGTILGTWALNFGFPLFELTLNFAGGRIHLRCLDGEMEVLDYSTKQQQMISVTRDTSRWDQYRASFGKSQGGYLDSVRRGEAPPVPGIAGLEELRFEAALRRSVRLGRTVKVDEEFSLQPEEGVVSCSR